MHSSRRRTACSLTASRSIGVACVHAMPCTPPTMHTPLPYMSPCHVHPLCYARPPPRMPPPAMHAPPVNRILDTRLRKHYLPATKLRAVIKETVISFVQETSYIGTLREIDTFLYLKHTIAVTV